MISRSPVSGESKLSGKSSWRASKNVNTMTIRGTSDTHRKCN